MRLGCSTSSRTRTNEPVTTGEAAAAIDEARRRMGE
jgi:hypothetical protein